MAIDADAQNLNVGLVHIFLVNEVNAGLGSGENVVARRLGLSRRQSFKSRAQLGFHGHWVEVAADADDEFAADGAVVPGLESSRVTAPMVASSGWRVYGLLTP